jgi:hypothetical protein
VRRLKLANRDGALRLVKPFCMNNCFEINFAGKPSYRQLACIVIEMSVCHDFRNANNSKTKSPIRMNCLSFCSATQGYLQGKDDSGIR